MAEEPIQVLIVEDEEIIAFDLKNRLERLGYQVTGTISKGEEALALVPRHNPDIVLMDIMLEGDMDGVEAASRINSAYDIPVVYLTASSDEETFERAKRTQPFGYIIKPFDENLLRITIEMAIYKHRMEERVRRSEERMRRLNESFLNFRPDPDTNINQLTAVCGELMGGACAIYNSLKGGLLTTAGRWQTPPELKERDEAEGHICFDVIKRGDTNPFLVRHLQESEYAETDPNVQQFQLQTYIGQAVRSNDQVVGALCVVYQNDYEPTDDDTKLIGILAAAIGIEEDRKRAEKAREQLQSQLIQSQKLESVGVMAGGVAHEINNPLMGIINYAQLVHDKLDDTDEDLRIYAQEIIKEGERISSIVKNLLAFSRQDQEIISSVPIRQLVDDGMMLVKRMMEKDEVTVKYAIPEDISGVACRKQQIEQVLLNLLNNARDSLNQKYKGFDENKQIIIRARSLPDSDRIEITVEDHGVGVPEEVRDKLFDPFFSTKPKQQGTGLGLSVSYGIIQEHGGVLGFVTRPGEYTRFFFDLPVAKVKK